MTPVLILFNFSPARAAALSSCARDCGFEVRIAAGSEHRSPLASISGPAVLTPVNVLWTPEELHRELKKEHQALSR